MTCNLPDHAAAVNALLEGFVRVCQLVIESGLAPPDPLQANVQYKLEPPGQEDWKLPQNVIRDGWGDCEDMAGWRAGGLRATGQDPDARAEVRRTGPHKLHCVVVRSDGSVEDPSHELWQRQPEGLRAGVLGAGPIIHDFRRVEKGGTDPIRAFRQKRFLAAYKAGKVAPTRELTKVIDPETGQTVDDKQPAGWKGTATSAAQRQDTATQLQQARQDEQDVQAQEQQYDDGSDQYDDGYGYGGGYGYGVDPDWQGPADWVDPRAIAAFQDAGIDEDSGLTYDDNLNPIDQEYDDAGA